MKQQQVLNLMLRVMGVLVALNVLFSIGKDVGVFSPSLTCGNGRNDVLCSDPPPSDNSCGYSFPETNLNPPKHNGKEKKEDR